MFNLVVRERIIDILSQKYGKQIEVQNSSLLRLYATMKAMCDTTLMVIMIQIIPLLQNRLQYMESVNTKRG